MLKKFDVEILMMTAKIATKIVTKNKTITITGSRAVRKMIVVSMYTFVRARNSFLISIK